MTTMLSLTIDFTWFLGGFRHNEIYGPVQGFQMETVTWFAHVQKPW
jgi:hypothetical protein